MLESVSQFNARRRLGQLCTLADQLGGIGQYFLSNSSSFNTDSVTGAFTLQSASRSLQVKKPPAVRTSHIYVTCFSLPPQFVISGVTVKFATNVRTSVVSASSEEKALKLESVFRSSPPPACKTHHFVGFTVFTICHVIDLNGGPPPFCILTSTTLYFSLAFCSSLRLPSPSEDGEKKEQLCQPFGPEQVCWQPIVLSTCFHTLHPPIYRSSEYQRGDLLVIWGDRLLVSDLWSHPLGVLLDRGHRVPSGCVCRNNAGKQCV